MTPRRAQLFALAGVLAVVAALYLPSLAYPFLSLDDHYGVVENPGIRDLSWRGVRFLFLEDHRDWRWFPLAYLSFAADYAVSGLDPAAFHRTNLLLHLVNTALVFALVRTLSRDTVAAAVASALFGLHPLQVESVAWVSSRKNLVFFCFFLLSIFAYREVARRGGGARSMAALAASVALFFLSIAAKTTAVTLPAVLLLVDHQLAPDPPRRPLAFVVRQLASKLAYLPVIAIAWLATRALARRIPLRRDAAFDAFDWIVVVGHNLFFYVAKAIAPIHLGVFYPLPDDRAPLLPLHYYGFALLAVGLVAVCLACRRRHPLVFFGLAWYLVTILPMAAQPVLLGDLPLVAADRYFYQSSVGLFLLAGLACSAAWRRTRAGTALGAAVVLALLFVLSWRHEQSFRDTTSLYEQTVQHSPSDEFYYRLALEYDYQGRTSSAFRALELAEAAPAQIFFTHVFVYQMELSDLYRRKGELAKAAAFLAAAIASTPNAIEPAPTNTPLAYRYLASLYDGAGDRDRAAAARAEADRAAWAPQSYFESQWFTIAPDAAVAFLERRVALAPSDAGAWYYLGRFHQLRDAPERSRECLARARELGFRFP